MKTTERILAEIEKLEKECKEHYLPYRFYGIRFEKRNNIDVGCVLENSKTNIDRNDSRDFPEFGTPEYDDLEELDGTCAYFVFDGEKEKRSMFLNQVIDCVDNDDDTYTWYLIGSEKLSDEEGEDDNEIIMVDATVIVKI